MPQPIHVSGAIPGLVMAVGRGAVHQILDVARRPGCRAMGVEQIARNADDPGRQLRDRPAQAMHLPMGGRQPFGQATTDITAASNQNSWGRHLATPKIKTSLPGEIDRRLANV
ncbi:hypothetical protein D9M73_293440 [compost metagenome]